MAKIESSRTKQRVGGPPEGRWLPRPPERLVAAWRRFLNWFEPRRDALYDALTYYRGAAVAAIGLAFAFAALDQTHEIYLQLATDAANFGDLWDQPDGAMRIARLVFSYASLVLLSVVIWMNARWLSLRSAYHWWRDNPGDEFADRSPDYRRLYSSMKRWMPRILGALPPGGMAVGMVWTALSDEGGDSGGGGVTTGLVLGALIAAGLGAAFLRVVILRKKSGSYEDDRAMFRFWQIAGLLAFAVFALAVAVFPVSPAQAIGPVGILCLFGVGLSVILTWLTYSTHAIKVPWVSLLVALAVILSVLDVNDNHRLDMLPPGQGEAAPGTRPATPSEAFKAWIAARSIEPGETYDVYVFAAQGGGLYAAYHTAMLLARAQDRNPAFADHLFAVSGVSGGSVGAAIFHAVLRQTKGRCPSDEPDCHVEKVRAVLRRDFLSPTMASMLFPDFTARFLPLPGDRLTLLSRARALEAGFAGALESVEADPNRLLMESWRPGIGAEAGPLLLLNTTDVNTGERMLMTPLMRIYENEAGLTPAETLAEVLGCAGSPADCESPRLLTAALVSARFPIVTPAARLDLAGRDDRRYVDGGYFENSGVETAIDLLSQIHPEDLEPAERESIQFHLIALDFPGRNSGDHPRSYWMGEVMSPVRAFLNTRSARGELPKRRAWQRQEWIDYHAATLDNRNAQFTLGWVLSARTFDQIEFELWNDAAGERIGATCLTDVQRENRHLLRRLVWELPWESNDPGGYGLPDCS